MTSLKFRIGPAWLLALAIAPWLVGTACSDDDALPNDGPIGGSGGTAGSAGAGGGAGNVGISGAGGTGGASGSGGSAGTNSSAGSGGGMSSPDAGPEPDSGGPDASAQVFRLTSTAVDDVPGCGPGDAAEVLCDLFPAENTGLNGAANVSPQLDWTGAPAGTQSFAIAFHDLSNLNGQDPFTHWVMWNIPASSTGLPAELPEGFEPGVPDDATRQVSFLNSKNNGFAGSGAAGNVYEFVLFALGTASIDAGDENTSPDAAQNAIAGSTDILGTATLRARSAP